jgi:crossover junction endodeoxyribonuclease RuvC
VIVLGIDPGSTITGYGVVRRTGPSMAQTKLVECGIIRTRSGYGLPARLLAIYEGVRDLIAKHDPVALAVEDAFYARNAQTTLILGHARGVVLLAGAQAGLPVHEYPPREIKKAVTGTGAATKEQVQFMVTRLLRLKSIPEPSDAADGVAAALTYCLSVGIPVL